MKTLEINGQDFSSLEGFYKSLEPILISGDCPWGQNLDSLNEVVLYNFNYTDNKEADVSIIVWYNFNKSKSEIRDKRGTQTVLEIIEEIFKSNKSIKFFKK
jgi:RNAse (barnase) inhibitor barstar